MAYFIVIGTDNSVQPVVDEIRESHLQRDVVTSGCVIDREGSMFYHWDVYNAIGERRNEGDRPTTSLRDALTNQIAQFSTLLPDGSKPRVFLVGSCHTEEDAIRIKYVYDSLCEIGGHTLCGITIDIVLLGYDLDRADDVTLAPSWKSLRKLKGIENGRFHTDVLYLNNMDYAGAATNVDARLLGRFLSHWAMMQNGGQPKPTVKQAYYAIGMAERQYCIDDLVPFFKLAAEEQILDLALNGEPSPATQQMLDSAYYSRIDLSRPWIDGWRHIRDAWQSYCTTPYDYARAWGGQPYSLAVQQQRLALYLNGWLAIYCRQQQRDIDELYVRIEDCKQQIALLETSLASAREFDPETGEEIETAEAEQIRQQIADKKDEIDRCQNSIDEHKRNIDAHTFADAEAIKAILATGCLTNAQMATYRSRLDSERALFEYLRSDESVDLLTGVIDRAVIEDEELPEFPFDVIDNVGRLTPLTIEAPIVPPVPPTTPVDDDGLAERIGCIGWFKSLFHSGRPDGDSGEPPAPASPSVDIPQLHQQVGEALREYRRIREVENWWLELKSTVERKQQRREQCIREMDGEVLHPDTPLASRKGGFKPPFHRKSISLIDMAMVRAYRDQDAEYLGWLAELKSRFFDASVRDADRPSMQEFIRELVIDAIRSKWHLLRWDGTNPFCVECFSDDELHRFIEDPENGMHKQSKPFVVYVKQSTDNIKQHINFLFYFGHPDIKRQPNEFRKAYEVSEVALTPVYLKGFENSLCEVQVMDVTDHVDSLADFQPRTEAVLNESYINYAAHVGKIVGTADKKQAKAKAIYDWLTHNIAYDTTYQIHDADHCWETRRGVCQAYCELFVHLAKQVGLTAEIVCGKSKDREGHVSDKGHAWIFVYLKGYDGIFIDPTWGAGYLTDGVFTPAPNDTWFNVNPNWLIFSHFADDDEWNGRASSKLTLEQFEQIPYMEPKPEKGEDTLFAELAKLQQ